ncbi:MAG: esterase-like activity of phytase family protein [Pseudomonadota bacterium]
MRIVLSVLLLLLCQLSASGEEPRLAFDGGARMVATRLPLDAGDPARTRVGALTYLGGIRLTSPQIAFGGFSSIQVAGDRFTLLSDGGHIVHFRMGEDFRPGDVQFGALAAGPGTGWRKSDRDSESQTTNPATGRVWIGFEQTNAIWRFDGFGRAETHAQPKAMAEWSANGGPEAMVRRADGSFLVISETTRPPGGKGRVGLIFGGDPTDPKAAVQRFTYQPPEGYDPTDMAELPDGRLLVLNRRVSIADMFTGKLVLIERGAVRPGAAVAGREIATLASPLLHDNFEALAVTQEKGATILWIASDDNREWFEKSLLLKFRLEL